MIEILSDDAPFYANLFLVVELVIGVLLLAGMFLVRRGHVRAHMYIQSSMVLVNIPIVLLWMLPSYTTFVLPDLGEISQAFYWVPTLMLVVGAAAEILGVYIILVAGTNVVPARWRFRRYKLWMRTELVLWWSVLLLGVGTYYVWYSSAGYS
ncbi:MAG TPA: hypothetical protein VIZ68_06045 [Thermoplasmata archaeon]